MATFLTATQMPQTCGQRLRSDAVTLKTIRIPIPNFSPQCRVGAGVFCSDGGRLDGQTLALLEHVLVGNNVFSPKR